MPPYTTYCDGLLAPTTLFGSVFQTPSIAVCAKANHGITAAATARRHFLIVISGRPSFLQERRCLTPGAPLMVRLLPKPRDVGAQALRDQVAHMERELRLLEVELLEDFLRDRQHRAMGDAPRRQRAHPLRREAGDLAEDLAVRHGLADLRELQFAFDQHVD